MIANSVVYLVLVSALAAQAYSENSLNKAYTAYLSGDYREPYRLWLNAAQDGNTSAQMFLGYLYERGKGMRRDDTQAMAWY